MRKGRAALLRGQAARQRAAAPPYRINAWPQFCLNCSSAEFDQEAPARVKAKGRVGRGMEVGCRCSGSPSDRSSAGDRGKLSKGRAARRRVPAQFRAETRNLRRASTFVILGILSLPSERKKTGKEGFTCQLKNGHSRPDLHLPGVIPDPAKRDLSERDICTKLQPRRKEPARCGRCSPRPGRTAGRIREGTSRRCRSAGKAAKGITNSLGIQFHQGY